MKKFTLVFAATAVFTATPLAFADSAAEASATLLKMLDSARNNDVVALYDWLPESYRNDVSAVMKDFAKKIDADVYNAVRETVVAIAEVGIAKPEFVAKAKFNDSMPDAETVAFVSSALKNLAEKLTLETLAENDVAEILAHDGVAEILKRAEVRIPEIKITAAKTNDDGTVTISIDVAGNVKNGASNKLLNFQFDNEGENERNVVYRNIGGSWLPAEFAEKWKLGVADFHKTIADGGLEIDDETKEEIIGLAAALKLFLTNAARSRNQNQMEQNLMLAFLRLSMFANMYKSENLNVDMEIKMKSDGE